MNHMDPYRTEAEGFLTQRHTHHRRPGEDRDKTEVTKASRDAGNHWQAERGKGGMDFPLMPQEEARAPPTAWSQLFLPEL